MNFSVGESLEQVSFGVGGVLRNDEVEILDGLINLLKLDVGDGPFEQNLHVHLGLQHF